MLKDTRGVQSAESRMLKLNRTNDPVSPTNKLERERKEGREACDEGRLGVGGTISHLQCVAHVWILI